MLTYKVGLAIFAIISAIEIFKVQSQRVSVDFNGACPNITHNLSSVDWSMLNGEWYMFGVTAQIFLSTFECYTRNVTISNGSIYFVDRYINPGQNYQEFTSSGQYLIDDVTNTFYVIYTSPFQTVFPFKWLPINGTNDVHIYYICNDCGYYGSQDSGVKYFAFVRNPKPDCLTTDPIELALNDEKLVLTDHSNCTKN